MEIYVISEEKNMTFYQTTFFLLNQLKKVCTFYAIAPFNTLWT